MVATIWLHERKGSSRKNTQRLDGFPLRVTSEVWIAGLISLVSYTHVVVSEPLWNEPLNSTFHEDVHTSNN